MSLADKYRTTMPTANEKRALIHQSLDRLPCPDCKRALEVGVSPHSAVRCVGCLSSMRHRWQVQQRINGALADPQLMENLRRMLAEFRSKLQ